MGADAACELLLHHPNERAPRANRGGSNTASAYGVEDRIRGA